MDFDDLTTEYVDRRDSSQTLAANTRVDSDRNPPPKGISLEIEEEPNNARESTNMNRTHRKLDARHLEMIAIGGTIGTGLLLKSGGAIFSAGPLGALLCYIIVGLQVFGVATAIGEMATYLPVEGAFSQLPTRFVSPSFGFASGWNYWLNWALTIPAELSAIGQYMGFWISKNTVQEWVWPAVYLAPLIVINFIGVRSFGEVEYVLSILKVIAVVLFLVVGFLVWFGVGTNKVLGFSNWNPAVVGDDPLMKFSNIATAFITAFFSYGGTELVGITAGEARNPRKAVPRAINGTFYRIILFYVGAIFIVGVLLPPNSSILDPNSTSTKQSPFVYAFSVVGIGFAADAMNGIAIVAALSAANSSIYACSRTLMRLAAEGSAPACLSYVRPSNGIPVPALALSIVFGALAAVAGYISGTMLVFQWLSNVIAISIMISWMVMCFTHLRFRYGYLSQGRVLRDLPYVAPFFPYADYLSIIIGFVVTCFMVFGAFFQVEKFDMNWFIANPWLYCGMPLVTIAFIAHSLWGRSNGVTFFMIRFEDMDFETSKLVETPEETIINEVISRKPKTIKERIQRIAYKLF
ncbi:hypothetical protein HDU84_004455 [Entophlyctis sp. JEL0112]|nr:hypothetical protein HDU84_004455 [Entophlyctis sp. JEL0112]